MKSIKDCALAQGIRKFFDNMKGLSLREKIESTFYLYKLELGVIVAAIFIVIAIISMVVSANTNLLLSGDVMNVSMSEEGMKYMNEEYFATLGVRPFMNKVHVVESVYSTSEDEDFEYNYTVSSQVVALVSAEMLDFQIINRQALEMFLSEDMYLDLREFFTAEELAQYEGKIIYLEYESTKEMVPVALDISDMPFVQDNVAGRSPTFFAIIKTTPRKAELRNFWEYLWAWEKKETVTTAPAA
jgi:hypothetical protein